jgi:hypothetical protein
MFKYFKQSILEEVNFFSLSKPSPALGPGVQSASTRNEYQKQKKMFLGSKVWLVQVHRADNLATIPEPTV